MKNKRTMRRQPLMFKSLKDLAVLKTQHCKRTLLSWLKRMPPKLNMTSKFCTTVVDVLQK